MLDLIVQLLSVSIPVAGGFWAAWRYIDTRRQENEEKRLERYATTIREMSGLRPDGTRTFLVENIAAIYRLLEFPEKRDVSVVLLEESMKLEQWDSLLGHHARQVLQRFGHGDGATLK